MSLCSSACAAAHTRQAACCCTRWLADAHRTCVLSPLPPASGHSKEAGAVSLEALAQGRHRVVEAISGEARALED